MKTQFELDIEQRKEELDEAKRLLSIMDKKTALIFCEELAKKLPNINDTPPINRKHRSNYMQFYYNGVRNAINKTVK